MQSGCKRHPEVPAVAQNRLASARACDRCCSSLKCLVEYAQEHGWALARHQTSCRTEASAIAPHGMSMSPQHSPAPRGWVCSACMTAGRSSTATRRLWDSAADTGRISYCRKHSIASSMAARQLVIAEAAPAASSQTWRCYLCRTGPQSTSWPLPSLSACIHRPPVYTKVDDPHASSQALPWSESMMCCSPACCSNWWA